MNRCLYCLSMDERLSSHQEKWDQLFTDDIARALYGKVVALAQRRKLTSHEHFMVDGHCLKPKPR